MNNKERTQKTKKTKKTLLGSFALDHFEVRQMRTWPDCFKWAGYHVHPVSKEAYLAGNSTPVHSVITLPFDKPSDALEALAIWLRKHNK